MALFAQKRASPLVGLLLGFLAGFVSTLIFHQGTVALLAALGAIPTGAYAFRGVPPLGVPQVISLAFWGGLWGCVWALLAPRLAGRMPLWLAGLIFGAIFPTLGAWFVAAPLKGQAVAAGWVPSRMWIGPVINGMWGLGTALLYDLLQRSTARRSWFS